jgi:hypothetical protein
MFSILKKISIDKLNKPLSIKRINSEDVDTEIAVVKAKISAVDKEIVLIDKHIKELKSHHKKTSVNIK